MNSESEKINEEIVFESSYNDYSDEDEFDKELRDYEELARKNDLEDKEDDDDQEDKSTRSKFTNERDIDSDSSNANKKLNTGKNQGNFRDSAEPSSSKFNSKNRLINTQNKNKFFAKNRPMLQNRNKNNIRPRMMNPQFPIWNNNQHLLPYNSVPNDSIPLNQQKMRNFCNNQPFIPHGMRPNFEFNNLGPFQQQRPSILHPMTNQPISNNFQNNSYPNNYQNNFQNNNFRPINPNQMNNFNNGFNQQLNLNHNNRPLIPNFHPGFQQNNLPMMDHSFNSNSNRFNYNNRNQNHFSYNQYQNNSNNLKNIQMQNNFKKFPKNQQNKLNGNKNNDITNLEKNKISPNSKPTNEKVQEEIEKKLNENSKTEIEKDIQANSKSEIEKNEENSKVDLEKNVENKLKSELEKELDIDDEYKKQLQLQKKLREEYLKAKEERRKNKGGDTEQTIGCQKINQANLQKNNQPNLQKSNQQNQFKNLKTQQKNSQQLKVVNQNNGPKKRNNLKEDNETKERTVIIKNLTLSCKIEDIFKICNDVGPTETLNINITDGDKNAVVVFKNKADTINFQRKFNFSMLDQSLIQVEFL